MSLIMGFLSSAVGGALLGEFGKGITTLVSDWKEDRASARKIREMQALSNIKVDEKLLDVFQEGIKSTYSDFTIPSQCSPIAATVFSSVLLFIHFCIRMVRVILIGWAAYFLYHLYNTSAGEDRKYLVYELTAICFACVYMWLGERYQKRTTK